MRYIRFKKDNSDLIQYGKIIDEKIQIINGNPFTKHSTGDIVGNLNDVKLMNPCVPTKVVAFATNYCGATGVSEDMSEPVVFIKPAESTVGPYDDIVCPFKNVRVWGEAELGVVIGKRISKVSLKEAEEAIFGYVCANDVTAENIEGRDHHLVRSKGANTFCPFGPWIDTEFDPSSAKIEAFQNGKLIRQGDLKNRIWKDVKAICWLSQWMTLNVGDIVITGTPPRVVKKTYLNDGDTYEVVIEGLGRLKNKYISTNMV